MLGPTHMIGGVAALATAALITDTAHAVPVWAYGLAAVSALVPDADNEGGSLMHRPILLPLKMISAPLWMNAGHRMRSHSLVATAGYMGIIGAIALALDLALALLGPAVPRLPLWAIVMAAGAGYLSHLLLDLPNIPGIMLLWPIRARVFFPPWRAHGLVPGRFETGTWWELGLVAPLLTMFLGWYLFANLGDLGAALAADRTLLDLPRAVIGTLAQMIREILTG